MHRWASIAAAVLLSNGAGAVDSTGCSGSGVVFPPGNADTLTCSSINECKNCDVKCNAQQDCNVLCSISSSCNDMVVTCPKTGKCSISCTATTSCSRLRVFCPQSGDCEITCAGSNSCSDMVITQLGSGGGLLLRCQGFQGCERVTADCPESSSCDIKCDNDYSCPDIKITGGNSGALTVSCGGNGCSRMVTACPATSGACQINCNGGTSCSGSKITSGDTATGTMQVNCGQSKSCDNMITTCPGDAPCSMNCQSYQSCYNSKIDCPATSACHISCPGSNACQLLQVANTRGGVVTNIECAQFSSCQGSRIQCGTSACTRLCSASNSCQDAALDCSNAPSCSTSCTGSQACSGNSISCASGYAAGNACTINCDQYAACTNTAPTGAAGPVTCSGGPATNVCSPELAAIAASTTAIPGVPTTLIPTAVPTAVPVVQQPLTSPPTSVPTSPPTGVPPTNIPTGVPGVPPTSVPTGVPGVPPTNAPPTAVPATSSPFTGVPPTPAPPGTTALPTTASPPGATVSPGATDTPQTMAPAKVNGTVIPEKEAKMVRTTSSVSSAVALVGGGSAGSASRLAVLQNFGCQVQDVDLEEEQNLDWEFHPTQVGISHNGRRYMTAAMILNPMLLVAMFLVLLFVTFLIHFFLNVTWHHAAGNARSPGLVYIPYLFLLQGTSLVAARLAFYPRGDSAVVTVVAAIMLTLCIVSPAGIYLNVLRHVDMKACHVLDPKLYPREGDERKPYTGWTAAAYRFAFGEYVWVSRKLDTCFVEKYGVVFESFKQGLVWFAVVELMVILGLSILSSWQPGTGSSAECDARNVIICLLFAVFLGLLLYYRPYTSIFDNIIAISLCAMMFFAVLFMTIGIWSHADPNSWMFTFPGYLLLISAIVVLGKSIWDISVYAVDIWVGRKTGAKEVVRKQQESIDRESFFRRNPLFKRANFNRMSAYSDCPSDPSLGQSLMEPDLKNGVTPPETPLAAPAVPVRYQHGNTIIITCESVSY